MKKTTKQLNVYVKRGTDGFYVKKHRLFKLYDRLPGDTPITTAGICVLANELGINDATAWSMMGVMAHFGMIEKVRDAGGSDLTRREAAAIRAEAREWVSEYRRKAAAKAAEAAKGNGAATGAAKPEPAATAAKATKPAAKPAPQPAVADLNDADVLAELKRRGFRWTGMSKTFTIEYDCGTMERKFKTI